MVPPSALTCQRALSSMAPVKSSASAGSGLGSALKASTPGSSYPGATLNTGPLPPPPPGGVKRFTAACTWLAVWPPASSTLLRDTVASYCPGVVCDKLNTLLRAASVALFCSEAGFTSTAATSSNPGWPWAVILSWSPTLTTVAWGSPAFCRAALAISGGISTTVRASPCT